MMGRKQIPGIFGAALLGAAAFAGGQALVPAPSAPYDMQSFSCFKREKYCSVIFGEKTPSGKYTGKEKEIRFRADGKPLDTRYQPLDGDAPKEVEAFVKAFFAGQLDKLGEFKK